MPGYWKLPWKGLELISELEDEIVIKRKTEELLVRQHKTCERNMQELTNSIKRPNLRIKDIEEGEEEWAKGISNIFNKIITEETKPATLPSWQDSPLEKGGGAVLCMNFI
jgi:chaperonin cofactor prefoldin